MQGVTDGRGFWRGESGRDVPPPIGLTSGFALMAGDPPGGASWPLSRRVVAPEGESRALGVVYLVSADSNLRKSLLWLLASAGYTVEACAYSDDVFDRDTEMEDCCVVMDLCSSPTCSVGLLDRLGRRRGRPPVILLSGYGAPLAVVQSHPRRAQPVAAPRPFDLNLLDRIDEAMAECRRRRWLRETAAELALQLPLLTTGERKVLDGLIAGQVGDAPGAECGVDGATVEAERSRLMEKLRVGSRGDLLQLLLMLEEGAET